VDDLWATKSEDVGLMFTQLVYKIFNQHHRQTDRQTTCNRKTAFCTPRYSRWQPAAILDVTGPPTMHIWSLLPCKIWLESMQKFP